MTEPLRLFDLFGAPPDSVVAAWTRRIQPTTGVSLSDDPPAIKTWLSALNNVVSLSDVRTGADEHRVAVEAKLFMPGSPSYPDGFPFVFASMPDVEFRIRPDTLHQNEIQLFASLSDRGVEVVLERLPVEIRLPPGFIDPHPKPGGDVPDGTHTYEIGEFRPGHLDDLLLRFDQGKPASIFVHVRLHMTEAGEFSIRPAVPVSFGRCVFSGIPVLALHDFQLLPSPTLAPREVHWLRHEVTPWAPQQTGPLDGSFSIRSVSIDPETAPIADLAHFLNARQGPPTPTGTAGSGTPPATGTSDPTPEFVLDDLVVPFFSPWVLPIPRHVSIGVRRRIINPDDPAQVFRFDQAPVRTILSRSPEIGLIVDSLFFKSLPSGVGLTFEMAFVFGGTNEGGNKSDAMALGIGLEEDYTLTVSYRREFSSTTGLPEPGSGAAQTLNALLHFEIVTNTVDIMTIRLGYSIGRHLAAHLSVGEFDDPGEIKKALKAAAMATVDLFVNAPPSGSNSSPVKLRSLNGEPVKFALEGIGYRFGELHLEGVALPDGVVLLIGDVGIVLQELGLRAEDGASYVSFSGGLQVATPAGFTGSFLLKRLRIRFAGDPGAPRFKLDGLFITLKSGTFKLEAGGYFTETRDADVLVREFALTGTAQFKCGDEEYRIGLDFLIGQLESPALTFKYLLAQAFFTGSVPIGAIELRGARVLFARNMQPKLEEVDKDSRELRYYTWYKRSDPLTVPGDRRLAAWLAQDHALAVGVGASISVPGLGAGAELIAFVLYADGPEESGLLIVAEVHLQHNPRAVGFLVFEMDFERDLWRGVLGVELRLSDFEKDAPDWLNKVGVLTGTLFIGNKPTTVALGRLADQRTWFQIAWNFRVFGVGSSFELAACFEYVEDQVYGVGFVLRVEGGINCGIVRAEYYAGLGFAFQVLATGSNDYGVEVFVELGLRIVLFRFLHFGLGARADLHLVGSRPTSGQLHLEVRLETPWFLPDVTWTLDVPVGGALAVADLATSTSPLRSAGATQGPEQKSATLHVERFDQGYVDDRPSRTFSVHELRAGGPDEATRLARFAADTDARPMATDATVAVDFAVAVNDKLALSTGVAPNLGDQKSGELQLSYDLVGVAVRRRPRFGSARPWEPLDTRIELPADFSDPDGVKLGGAFEPATLAAHWDLDAPVDGKPGTKRLLLNSATPFQFATSNAVADEELVRGARFWPCCDRKSHLLRTHGLNFQGEMLGAELDASPHVFSDSASRLVFNRPAVARGQRSGTFFPPMLVVADVPSAQRAGVVARLDFDEDVAFCTLTLGWSATQGRMDMVAFDRTGTVVGIKPVPTTSASDFVNVTMGAQGPIRRVELRAVRPQIGFGGGAFLEIHSASYTALGDFLDFSRQQLRCNDTGGEFHDAYEGKGKLAFLPNHEYEVELTTRITASHPSAQPESVDVPEYVYFRTKGLPGLNAVARVGEEVEQYVRGAYGGGRGLLYRREPVVLAFSEDFFVAVPLQLRPAGTAAERTTLLRMQLLARADAAVSAATPFTSTSSDWIVDHRGQGGHDPTLTVWQVVLSQGATRGSAMRTVNPFRERLAVLTQRPTAGCDLADPRDVSGSVLVAPPQGEQDPDDPTQQLWPASLRHTATVRAEAAPFTERLAFDPADLTAFDFALDSGFDAGGAWSVDTNGVLRTAEGSARHFAVFGDPTWNHYALTVALSPSGSAAGVAIGLPASGPPSQALFALIEATPTGQRLALYRRTTGDQMVELAAAPLPASSNADPAAPVTLQVTAFDDRIRATVGEQSIEADRDEQREGRVALVAKGAAGFSSLSVVGVPIYAFPFSTSRYRSFRHHILSWPGTLDVVRPDGLGAGTTSTTLAALWTATQAEVSAAMQPDADSGLRDALFQRWLRELGIPLKDELSRVELTRFVVNDKTASLILESPEPIDFTSEVTLLLEHKVKIVPGGGVHGEIVDVSRRNGGLDVQLSFGDGPLPSKPIVFVEAAETPDRLRVWTGTAVAARGAPTAHVHAVLSDEVTVISSAHSTFRDALQSATAGSLVAILPDTGGIIASPIFGFQPVPVRVIQSGSGKAAMVVPMTSANVPESLPRGTYRLTLTMDRPRWSTTEPADDVNRYRDAAVLLLNL